MSYLPNLNLNRLFKVVFYLLCVSVPLAAWKLIEIIIWLIKHISISIT